MLSDGFKDMFVVQVESNISRFSGAYRADLGLYYSFVCEHVRRLHLQRLASIIGPPIGFVLDILSKIWM